VFCVGCANDAGWYLHSCRMYRMVLPAESREANTSKVNNTLTRRDAEGHGGTRRDTEGHGGTRRDAEGRGGTARPSLWLVCYMKQIWSCYIPCRSWSRFHTFVIPTQCFCYLPVCFLLGSCGLHAFVGVKTAVLWFSLLCLSLSH